ncbi:MAG TPA: TonB-dependent receptor [Sphingomicrobium sp.]|nr:TonB-dependent receptor [Sphingomicrobium sp.]
MRGARWISSASAISLAIAATPAAAQETGDTAPAPSGQTKRTQVYDAAFFVPFAPSTALDIVRRVPGFTLELGNQDIRGFGAAAGNIVFNGQGPSSKADTLETILARIPAKRVLKVEVGPGDLYGAQYSGKVQVLNLFLTSESGIDGTVTLKASHRYSGLISPDANASVLIKRGPSSFNLAAGTDNVRRIEEGTDTITTLPEGELVEFRRKVNDYSDYYPFASAAWSLDGGENKKINANVRYSGGRFKLHQDNNVFPVGGDERDDTLDQLYKFKTFEIGGDITRPLAGGGIKLVALATRRHQDKFDGIQNIVDRNTIGGFEQTDVSQRNETIGRLTWSRSNLAGFSVETGIEVALNKLDSQVDLFVVEEGGEKTRIDLPIDSAVVKEERGEAFVNVGRAITPKLRADGGLAYEKSHLTVSGDTEAERRLGFWKPSLTLDWQAPKGWHIQASVKRTVAQLNFYDFISAAELSVNRVNGGNANLLPQTAWEFRTTIEHPILGDGIAKIELGYDKISMLQDRILVFDSEGNAFDAPGNLGDATRKFIAGTFDVPLAKFGIKGARLKLTGRYEGTEVLDPISGEERRFSSFDPGWQWAADYRHDLGKWAYGFNLSDRNEFAFFRIDEVDSNVNKGPYATAFIEYRPRPKSTITFDVDNLFETQATRDRIFSFPNRSVPPSLREFRERNQHRSFTITLKQGFGG